MKLGDHAKIEAAIFLVLFYFLGFQTAGVITLAHFVPTIDYVMARLNIRKHRQLFHNIFVAAACGFLLYVTFGTTTAILGFLNILFHLALDLDKENGVAILFPLSGKRLKL